jgi:hypothetical protein
MMSTKAFFQLEDLSQILPTPGYYPSIICNARFCHSARGNCMLHVVHRLEGVSPAYQHLADYFVLEGASPHGISVARRRLVQLYHACGFHPEEGEEILPSHLIDARLQIKVDQQNWDGQSRLRIVAYRPFCPPAADGQLPF